MNNLVAQQKASTYQDQKKVGNEYVGLCPSHDDHDPSLSVNREKNVWYCFGCGKGGDIHRFIQEWQSRDTR